eukprot:scaffold122835_cov36-Phaeocystis_antarctica.AAC.1
MPESFVQTSTHLLRWTAEHGLGGSERHWAVDQAVGRAKQGAKLRDTPLQRTQVGPTTLRERRRS